MVLVTRLKGTFGEGKVVLVTGLEDIVGEGDVIPVVSDMQGRSYFVSERLPQSGT